MPGLRPCFTDFAIRNATCELTESQRVNVERYAAVGLLDSPSVIIDLAQNALVRPRSSCKDRALCTLTCSSTRMYSPTLKRFLMPHEALLAQGFPATLWAARAARCTVRPVDGVSERATFKLAGNAMHAACVGSVLAWVLGFVRVQPVGTDAGIGDALRWSPSPTPSSKAGIDEPVGAVSTSITVGDHVNCRAAGVASVIDSMDADTVEAEAADATDPDESRGRSKGNVLQARAMRF